MKFNLYIMAAALFFTVSCTSKPAVVVNESFNGKEISVKAGDIFEVRLEAQFGTGYSWKYQSLPEIITPEGKPFQEKKDKETNKAGGFEYQIFQFKALKAGSSDLIFKYERSWETEKSDKKQIIFKLVIR